MALGKKTGGRQKGVPNKARREMLEQLAVAKFKTSLDYMLRILGDESIPPDCRDCR